MTPAETAQALSARFGAAVLDTVQFRDETSVVVSKEALVDVCHFLHDDLEYNFLSDISCTDWLDRDPRFDVVYHVTSLKHWTRFRVKVQTNDGEPVPTVIPVWAGANWAEREVWDLFGVEFSGHPDLRRILLPDGWVGHPLRKDFPQSQITLPRPRADKAQE